MNKATQKSRATLLGKLFESKGVTLTRAEQLNLVAQLEGARDWHHACGKSAEKAGRAAAERPFDALQLEAAKVYCSGEYAHLTSFKDFGGGDSLFVFVINEISDADGEREEAARMIRRAAEELNEVAVQLEDYPADSSDEQQGTPLSEAKSSLPFGHQATNSSGDNAGWKIRFLTDRFGERSEELEAASPDIVAWVQEHPAEMERMAAVCVDELAFELAFVADVNGKMGVLFEIEIETTESEGYDPKGAPRCKVSEEERRLQLTGDISDLEKKHPNLQWAVGGPEGMWGERLAVWAFSPAASLVTAEEAKALAEDLYSTYY